MMPGMSRDIRYLVFSRLSYSSLAGGGGPRAMDSGVIRECEKNTRLG